MADGTCMPTTTTTTVAPLVTALELRLDMARLMLLYVLIELDFDQPNGDTSDEVMSGRHDVLDRAIDNVAPKFVGILDRNELLGRLMHATSEQVNEAAALLGRYGVR